MSKLLHVDYTKDGAHHHEVLLEENAYLLELDYRYTNIQIGEEAIAPPGYRYTLRDDEDDFT